MDTKTNEQTLNALLKLKNSSYRIRLPIPKLTDLLPHLTEEIIEASIEDLTSKGLVKYQHADGTIYELLIMGKGISYFREKEELKSKELDKKKEDRRWDLIKLGIGYVAGVVSGIILMWIKQYI